MSGAVRAQQLQPIDICLWWNSAVVNDERSAVTQAIRLGRWRHGLSIGLLTAHAPSGAAVPEEHDDEARDTDCEHDDNDQKRKIQRAKDAVVGRFERLV
mmetsp:Transcript_47821/g.102166  ORF Transcript_47821/g.102166 Transcript_47821/m.102166 type:complete len:99 (-) Transcript_47821:468-764(-)|eukprot:scaffold287034_cov32-Tisochrysis_lutea.AAC.2